MNFVWERPEPGKYLLMVDGVEQGTITEREDNLSYILTSFPWNTGWCAKNFRSLEEIKAQVVRSFKEEFAADIRRQSPDYVPMVKRYVSYQDDRGYPYGFNLDQVWLDRKTNKVVLRYDLGDPANTNSDYGAMPDEYRLFRRGIDPKELMPLTDVNPICHPDRITSLEGESRGVEMRAFHNKLTNDALHHEIEEILSTNLSDPLNDKTSEELYSMLMGSKKV